MAGDATQSPPPTRPVEQRSGNGRAADGLWVRTGPEGLWSTQVVAPRAPSPPSAPPGGTSDGAAPGGPVAPIEPRAGDPGDAKPARRSRRWRWVLEWAAVLVVAVGVAVGIRTFVVQTFYIPSESMVPTLMVGDRILVDKLSYHLHAVHRGDVVVFGRPPGETADNVKDLVKRVIGLPGDVISSVSGHVDIDGKPLAEPWLPHGVITTGIETQKIPPSEYFVMGDNRTDSQDSRYFGPIRRSLIVGHVVLRIWPLSAIHFF